MKLMNRREIVRLLTLASGTALCGCSSAPFRLFGQLVKHQDEHDAQDIAETKAQESTFVKQAPPPQESMQDLKTKSDYFEQNFPDDVFFTGRKLELVKSLVVKFRAVQNYVGYGHFNVMGMDEFFRCAAAARGAGEITAEERLFLEEMFYFDAKKYGFQGDKVVLGFTDTLDKSSVVKVPGSGHFLLKGIALDTYEKIRKDVGESLILTSGVRALAKQYHLFFEKGLEAGGNMSKASRSLAPPGYSFHGQGDFDVGRKGYGLRNFTDQFAATEEYKKLLDLGYVQIRYTASNELGVRFEPWHIKVHSHG